MKEKNYDISILLLLSKSNGNYLKAKLIKLLSKKVLKLTIVSSTKEAVKMLQVYKPDLIISEYRYDGINIKSIIKKNKSKIIILYSAKEKKNLLTIIDLQISAYLSYPFKGKKLLELVRNQAQIISLEKENKNKITKNNSLKNIVENIDLKQIKNIANLAHYGIAIVDIKGNLKYLNNYFAKIHGYKVKDILGKNLSIFHNESQMLKVKKINELLLLNNYYVPVEVWHKKKNGKIFPMLMSGIVIRNKHGVAKNIVAMGIDISKQKEADLKIQNSEELFRAIFNTAEDSIFIKDKSFKYKSVNPAMERLLNLPAKKIIGKTDYDLFGLDVSAHIKKIDSQVLKGERVKTEDSLLVNGKQKIFHAIKVPLVDSHGVITGLCGIARDITEQKKSEKNMLASEQRQSTILEAISRSGIFLFVVDEHFKVRYMNKPMIDSFGNAVGKICYKKIGKQKDKCSYCKINSVITDGQTVCYQPTLDNGKSFDIQALPYTDIDGTKCKLEIIHDISDQVKIKKALEKQNEIYEVAIKRAEKSERQFTALFNQAPLSIQIFDNTGLSINVNEAWEKLWKSPSAKTINSYNILKDDYVKKAGLLYHIQKAFDGEVVYLPDMEYDPEMNKNIGRKRILRCVAFPIKSKSIVEQVVIIHQDITEIKKAELKLKESEANFRLLFEHSPLGTYIAKQDGTIIDGNKTMLKQLGSPSLDDTKKINVLQFPPLVENGYADKFKQCLLKKRIQKFEIYYKSKWNKGIYLSNYIVPLIDDLGNIIKVYTIMEDISDRVKVKKELIIAKEKAEEGGRLQSAFLANMSHEIRTPMNAILGFSDLLLMDDLSVEERVEYLEILNRSGKHLLNLINDIIDVSKIDANQLKIINREFALNQFMLEIYQQFHSLSNTKGKSKLNFKLYCELEDGNDSIVSDDTRLRQILTNLLGNAIKFTTFGKIELKYTILEDTILFSVSDTGIGIAEAEQEIIFDRFRQADETSTRKYGGTGLGLAISKACVELLGGKIWVKSKKEKGSTFYFTIPYVHVENQTVTEKTLEDKLEENLFLGKIFLIVEDDTYSFRLLQDMLKKTKVKLLHVVDGIEAIEQCKNNKDIDLVLMDIQLPKMDGLNATKEIKKLFPNLPVIAQTANVMSNDESKSLKAGCSDYISKPLNKQDLIKKISKYIF